MTLWFDDPGGIFCAYIKIGVQQVRNKFTEAETVVKVLYVNRIHQSDDTRGGADDASLLFKSFFNISISTTPVNCLILLPDKHV